ncbi:MAG TPA: BON domain-containing protein [Candidatus Acidoferrales bacterium]|nr:BON domain-containing protein [Candidatus Acidoferrales bacterium]
MATSSRSITVEHDRVQTSAKHHYGSPTERAIDDRIIAEVKSEIAEDGISNRYPVAVDCDHGTVLLSGVVESARDARRAARDAAEVRGVVAVRNRLTWR